MENRIFVLPIKSHFKLVKHIAVLYMLCHLRVNVMLHYIIYFVLYIDCFAFALLHISISMQIIQFNFAMTP